MTNSVIISFDMSEHPIQKIIERWPNRQSLADDAGVDLFAVHRWYQRKSIPARHDMALLDAASRRNISLNWRELMEARATHVDQHGHTAASVQERSAS